MYVTIEVPPEGRTFLCSGVWEPICPNLEPVSQIRLNVHRMTSLTWYLPSPRRPLPCSHLVSSFPTGRQILSLLTNIHVSFPEVNCSPDSFVHWMGKLPYEIQSHIQAYRPTSCSRETNIHDLDIQEKCSAEIYSICFMCGHLNCLKLDGVGPVDNRPSTD